MSLIYHAVFTVHSECVLIYQEALTINQELIQVKFLIGNWTINIFICFNYILTLCDFMGGDSSRLVATLLCLVVIVLVKMEI